MFPDGVWRHILSFLIYDPACAAVKREVVKEIRASFHTHVSGVFVYEGVTRNYYYVMTPIGYRSSIDYTVI